MMDEFDDNIDDDIEFLSETVINGYSGEDLCERANIMHENGLSVPLKSYNNKFTERMVDNDLRAIDNNGSDYIIRSMVDSVIDLKNDTYLSNSSSDKSDAESIAELLDESDINWTPNVLKKPMEDEFIESIFSSVPNLDDLYSVLSFNAIAVDPYESVQKAFSFNKSFLKRIKRIDCKDVRLELFLWPSILKNISITCVSGPKSGKTTSYLVPLMNWFDSREVQEIKDEIKLGAIVVCSSTRQTYEIAKQAKRWREPDIPLMEQTIRIVSMNSTNEKRQLTALLNGCDILITTPEPLLRAFNSSLIDCSNTKALIIDEADITLALHKDTVRQIYIEYAKIKKQNKRSILKNGKVSDPMAFQTMIFAEKWTQDIQWFYREIQHKPNVVFSSYYELSIAMKVNCRVELIDEEICREQVVKSLVKRAIDDKHLRIAIVCTNDRELSFLKRHLKEEISSYSTLVVTTETPHYVLEAKRNKWNRSGGLLFITDGAIRIVSGFQSSHCLIHYKIPKNFDEFGDRFRLMKRQFRKCKNPLETQKMPKLANYVVVSPHDGNAIKLIAYMNRLGVPVTQKLMSLCNYERRPLCSYFCSFGKCPMGSTYCPNRHLLTELDKPLDGLPQNGQIKFVVTFVKGANQFYIRLLEFRNESNSTGKWQKMAITYNQIRTELNSFNNMAFNSVQNISFKQVYGISIRGEVLRVRLIRILGEEELKFYQEYDPNDKNEKIELFCIDFGHKLRSYARQLFELPEHLKSLAPFAHKAYLFGIKPVDNEIEWDFKATQKFYDLVDNFRITQITSWILKQINGVFWLNRIYVEKRLNSADIRLESNPVKYMIDNKYVRQNPIGFPEVNTDYHKIVNIWHTYRLNNCSFNSCLVDTSTFVVVSDFVSLNEFYLIIDSRLDRLDSLEQKWFSSLPSLRPLIEVTTGQICFYRGIDIETQESYLNRAKILAIDGDFMDVFLVDHGETIRGVKKTNLFNILESDLKELPFQAIKVSLFGVKQIKPITYDVICDMTRNQQNQYLKCISEKVSYDNNVHTIRLFVANDEYQTQFVSLSKLLVDSNYCQFIDKEEDNQMEIVIKSEVEDSNEEINDYISDIEEYMKDQMCKHILNELGFNEQTFKKQMESQPSNESRASKTMQRLKAISAQMKNRNKKKESSDESEDENKTVTKTVEPNLEDFDYVVDPNAPLNYYDPEDHLDDECDYSDEEGLLEEEDLN